MKEETKSPKKKNGQKLPKVTKKELNLLKSLTEEEKEQFKRQVEEDEALVISLDQKIGENITEKYPSRYSFNSLTKKALDEMKSMSKPPELIKQLVCMVQVQLGVHPQEVSFANWRKLSANTGQLLSAFLYFEKERVDFEAYQVIEAFVKEHSKDSFKKVSVSCANLYDWLEAIHVFQSINL